MDLDPRHLEAFFVVGNEHSFSRAATLLHKSQPAVSYQIRRLEEQLGTRLFDRQSRRPGLTRAGSQLHELCRRFFGEFERLQTALRAGTAMALEPLRIAAVSGFGRYVLFPLLERQRALRYSLRYPTADQVFTTIEEGGCDLGFVYLPRVSSRLVTAPVWREELVLVGPGAGAAARTPAPARLEDFARLPFVTYDESEYVFGKWFEALFGSQPRALRSLYHFEELEEVVRTVAAGRGWSIVPDHAVAAAVRAGGVAIARPRRRRVGNLIYAVQRANGPDHPAATHIMDALLSTGKTSKPSRSR
jgi:DNA-binding transcriptional LysR family regulator